MEDALRDLKEALKSNADFTTRTEADIVGDNRLRRFLLSRNLDIQKTVAMIEDHLRWRKENDIEAIRAQVIDKPFLVTSFPYADALRQVGMGMQKVIVNGGRSRTGDIVYCEVLGGVSHIEISEAKSEDYIKMLFQHYYGFFERRSLYLEQESLAENRLLRCLQIRDVSQISIMPQGGVFTIIRKILKGGLDNYPESASNVIFINPPPIFAAIFAIVKRWLPEDTKRKLRSYSGEHVPRELLKFVRPSVIVATQRLAAGEMGDLLAEKIMNDKIPLFKSWKQPFERHVSARNVEFVYFAMSKSAALTISWTRQDQGEAPKSLIHSRVLYVRPEQAKGVVSEDVMVDSIDFPSEITSVSLPAEADEALLVIILDHTASWIKSHKFRFIVEAK